jgi:hypothetical protein
MQQYDQRRLRLFAVVLFLGIMAANLGRYLIFDGLYLWDARLRWQECAYVLHGLNPFDVMHSRVPSIESIGWLDASLGLCAGQCNQPRLFAVQRDVRVHSGVGFYRSACHSAVHGPLFAAPPLCAG